MVGDQTDGDAAKKGRWTVGSGAPASLAVCAEKDVLYEVIHVGFRDSEAPYEAGDEPRVTAEQGRCIDGLMRRRCCVLPELTRMSVRSLHDPSPSIDKTADGGFGSHRPGVRRPDQPSPEVFDPERRAHDVDQRGE